MARNSTPVDETTVEDSVAMTDAITVSPEQTVGLIGAWDGVYTILGGRVDSWEITPDGVFAHGFTVPSQFNPETILTDVNRTGHRVSLFPAINWLNGDVPAPFATPLDVQAWMTQYFKGSAGEGSTKVAEYVRKAAKAYRSETMGTARPGPKPKILKALASLDVSQLKDIDISDLDHIEDVLRAVRASQATNSAETVSA